MATDSDRNDGNKTPKKIPSPENELVVQAPGDELVVQAPGDELVVQRLKNRGDVERALTSSGAQTPEVLDCPRMTVTAFLDRLKGEYPNNAVFTNARKYPPKNHDDLRVIISTVAHLDSSFLSNLFSVYFQRLESLGVSLKHSSPWDRCALFFHEFVVLENELEPQIDPKKMGFGVLIYKLWRLYPGNKALNNLKGNISSSQNIGTIIEELGKIMGRSNERRMFLPKKYCDLPEFNGIDDGINFWSIFFEKCVDVKDDLIPSLAKMTGYEFLLKGTYSDEEKLLDEINREFSRKALISYFEYAEFDIKIIDEFNMKNSENTLVMLKEIYNECKKGRRTFDFFKFLEVLLNDPFNFAETRLRQVVPQRRDN